LEPIKVKPSMIEGDMTSGLAGPPPTVMSRLDMRLDGTSTRYLDPNDAVLIINPGDFKLLP